jgi:hypothetical protein
VWSSPWEANWFAASQIPRILWNLKVHYRIHKCPPPVSIRSLLILSSDLRLGLTSCFFPSGFPNKNPIHASLPHTHYMPRPYYPRFYHPNSIGWAVQIIKLIVIIIIINCYWLINLPVTHHRPNYKTSTTCKTNRNSYTKHRVRDLDNILCFLHRAL